MCFLVGKKYNVAINLKYLQFLIKHEDCAWCVFIYLLLYIEIYETYLSIYRTKDLTKGLQGLFIQVIQ